MRKVIAALVIVWAVANLYAAFLMVTNAFVSKTAEKEGLPAQLSLLVGGAAIEVLAVVLVWQAVWIIMGRDTGTAGA